MPDPGPRDDDGCHDGEQPGNMGRRRVLKLGCGLERRDDQAYERRHAHDWEGKGEREEQRFARGVREDLGGQCSVRGGVGGGVSGGVDG